MTTQTPFKWRHFETEIILLCVRLQFAIFLGMLAFSTVSPGKVSTR